LSENTSDDIKYITPKWVFDAGAQGEEKKIEGLNTTQVIPVWTDQIFLSKLNKFIEELSDKMQPKTHVRRVNGKELTDDEMIVYYTNLVKEYGGKLTAKWVYGMVICDNNRKEEYSWTKDHFYFVDQPCEKRNQGYPLDSISIVPEFNKYLVELTEEDKKQYKKKDNIDNVIEFIIKNVQK